MELLHGFGEQPVAPLEDDHPMGQGRHGVTGSLSVSAVLGSHGGQTVGFCI